MKGMTLIFNKQVEVGLNEFNEPITELQQISVDDCLIAPITEPSTAREQQAISQSRIQMRIHLPKLFSGDVSNSTVGYDGKLFEVDSDSVTFMPENTPTRWNRYFRAEVITQ